MADKNDSGDKTELPTSKKLRDARKKGDVAKSKDVSLGLLTLAWFIFIALGASYISSEIYNFFNQTLDSTAESDFGLALRSTGWSAVLLLIKISIVILVPIALLGMFIEYFQIGPVMTSEKMKPSLDKMNPVEGLKRMFGMDGLIELVKTLAKVILVCIIAYAILKMALRDVFTFVSLSETAPVAGQRQQIALAAANFNYSLTLSFLGLVVILFLLVGVLDRIYQKHRFTKKMMMSMRDIRKEHKDDEGDPHIKSQRRELQQQWANQNAIGAAGSASALLVNPTHIAIALDYDETDCPIPVIAAKGQGDIAAAMRAEAERCEVPIIRNIAQARKLWARGEIGEMVPEDMFDAIAEIILWAKRAREGGGDMWYDMDHAAQVSIPAKKTAQLASGDAAP
ncbi:MAG: EscU/YscU/HrcU family type III secretion system export apparatus switch protein [Sphingomonadales bacterium]|nr:EscU/YscU/HrcU family type III secretion system export apparatus switch protein [Sphingomonadales bacterium]